VSSSSLPQSETIHGLQTYRDERSRHWDAQADRTYTWGKPAQAYHKRLEEIYQLLVPEGARVIELGSGTGDLLAALRPDYGVGVDISNKMVELAAARYPNLTFVHADAHDLSAIEGTFDFVVLSDLLNELHDVQRVLSEVRRLCDHRTRIIFNFQSHLWFLPLQVARNTGLATPTLPQNWLTNEDVQNLCKLAGLEFIRSWEEILLPLRVPVLGSLCNKFLCKVWPLNHLALTHMMVARLEPAPATDARQYSVSIVVPARNEAGNIAAILERTPKLGSDTELIFVEGGSTDNTYETIHTLINGQTRLPARLFKQSGQGKGDAVRLGFAKANNEVLMILDADLSVAPEDLTRFYDALAANKGEFINGVRLVYPMQKKAMRFFNLLGNKFFSLGFSYVLGQPVKDTLCGTKVLHKTDYQRIADNRAYFGEFDPFGDFDLLFGAAKQNLRIVDIPLRYQARLYGETNISRWSDGSLLMKMLLIATQKLKYV
jgi:SAM-dependent methyltransferase